MCYSVYMNARQRRKARRLAQGYKMRRFFDVRGGQVWAPNDIRSPLAKDLANAELGVSYTLAQVDGATRLVKIGLDEIAKANEYGYPDKDLSALISPSFSQELESRFLESSQCDLNDSHLTDPNETKVKEA